MWIDNTTSPSTVHIMVAGPSDTSPVAAFTADLPTAGYVRVTRVKYTQSQLTEFQSTLVRYATASFPRLGSSRHHPLRFSPDAIDNAVKVTLSKTDASLLTQLVPLVPSDAWRVEWKVVTASGVRRVNRS